MPPKKGGKGGKRDNAGRSSGDYTELEDEEKLKYFREKRAEYRNQPSTPKKKEDRYPAPKYRQTSSPSKYKSSSSASTPRGPGRPPASPSGPKSPGSRSKSKILLVLAARSRQKLSDMRRKAAMRRWDGSVDTDQEFEPMELFVDDDIELEESPEVNEEQIETSRTKENPYGQMSDRTYFRKFKDIHDYFTSFSNFQQVDILVEIFSHMYKDPPIFNSQKLLIFMSNSSVKNLTLNRLSSWSSFQVKSRADKILNIISNSTEPEILLENLVCKTLMKNVSTSALLQFIGLHVDQSLRSRELVAHDHSLKVAETLSTQRTGQNKLVGVRHAVEVAKSLSLSVDNHGDILLLHKTIKCSRRFAKNVLSAIKEDKVDQLFKRETRKDAIKVTDWPELLKEFVYRPDNSRAVPGTDTVSIRYGVRMPKYILLRSRDDVLKNFQSEYPNCPFSTKILIREWPQNVKLPTTRDFDRNCCPVHSNARRMSTALRKMGILTDIPDSCRAMSGLVLCRGPSFSVLDQLTWSEDCGLRKCKNCPLYSTVVPDNLKSEMVTLSMWDNRLCPVRRKSIHALFPFTMSVQELAERFDKQLPDLASHIYRAGRQWEACKSNSQNLIPLKEILTVEDYQMNLEIIHVEATTSSFFGGNVLQIACYPVMIKFKLEENGLTLKGGLFFITEDNKHDYHQVEKFESRIFDFMQEKYGVRPEVWTRWSDQCAAQFKSQYTLRKLSQAPNSLGFSPESGCVQWSYFETGEGKNDSDSLGSIAKLAYHRGVAKNRDISVRTASEVTKLIRENIATTSAKLEFIEIAEVTRFDRPDRIGVAGIPVTGIQKLHHFTRTVEGKIIGRVLSCVDCLHQKTKLCEKCQLFKPVFDPSDEVEAVEHEEEINLIEDNETETETEADPSNDCDIGASEQENSESEDDLLESFGPNSIVWARVRSWYPAEILTAAEIPASYTNLISNQPADSVFVRRFPPFNDVKLVPRKNLDDLGENRVDHKRSSKSKEILESFNFAVAKMRGDLD